MSKDNASIAIGLLLWILWCVLVVTEMIPDIRRHLLMWPWLMAYVLCVAPVIAAGIFIIIRLKRDS